MGLEGKLKARRRIRIPYQDCDPGGVVWHGNYFRYFDAARVALLEKIDYGYRKMEKEGHVWPLIDSNIRFIHAVSFDDEIDVEATLTESEYRLKISYAIYDMSGRRVTKGWTVQVAVEVGTFELCIGSPPQLLDRLERYEKELEAAAH